MAKVVGQRLTTMTQMLRGLCTERGKTTKLETATVCDVTAMFNSPAPPSPSQPPNSTCLLTGRSRDTAGKYSKRKELR